jgi:hypothetical protein
MHPSHYPTPCIPYRGEAFRNNPRKQAEISREMIQTVREQSRFLRQRSFALLQQARRLRDISGRLLRKECQAAARVQRRECA